MLHDPAKASNANHSHLDDDPTDLPLDLPNQSLTGGLSISALDDLSCFDALELAVHLDADTLPESALERLAEDKTGRLSYGYFLFTTAMREFGYPANWEASKDTHAVFDFLKDLHEDQERQREDIPDGAGADAVLLRMASRVSQICVDNIDTERTQDELSRRQSIRGHLSGVTRRLGSVEVAAPWKAAGVSRATYYRHNAGQLTGEHGGKRKGAGRKRIK